jgi:hypothetical protein
MSTPAKILISIAWICICGAAAAQQPPSASPPSAPPPAATPSAKATAQSEAGEPRADTSGSVAAGTASAPAAASQAAPAPAPPAAPAPATGRTPPAPARTAQPKTDRLELGTATVTGDREQPKVMYIVPWKKSDIGDLTAKPMNSLVDEILAPVDRDVFKREVIYYRAVEGTSQIGASPKPAPQGEK